MALELVVENTEGMAEGVSGLYVEKDGKFHLDINGLPDVKGLTTTLDKQKQKILDGKVNSTTLQTRIDELESAEVTRLEKAGKTEEADNLKYDKYKTATDDRIARRDARITALEGSTLENIFRKVAVDAGVHKSAVDDVLLRAGSIFSLDADSKAVQFGADGTAVLGADGTSNYSPAEWMESMKASSPHWFPAGSSGSGAEGGDESGGDAKTVTREVFDKMHPVDKMKFSTSGGKVTA